MVGASVAPAPGGTRCERGLGSAAMAHAASGHRRGTPAGRGRGVARALLALAGLAFACAPPGPPDEEAVARVGFQLVDLVAEGPRPQTAGRAIARLSPAPGLAPWRVVGGTGRVLPMDAESPDGPFAVLFGGAGPRGLIVPAELRPANFTRLVVPVRSFAPTTLRVDLAREGQVVLRSQPVAVGRWLDSRPVAIDLPMTFKERRPFDELRLVDLEGNGPLALGPIELWLVPIAAFLPLPDDGPRSIRSGEVTRPGVVLTVERPLHATFHAPADGRLRLAFAPVPALPPSAPLQVQIELRDVMGGLFQRIITVSPKDDADGWTEVELPVDSQAGRDVSLTLSLRGRRDPVIVARPIVYVPVPSPSTVVLITVESHRADRVGSYRPQVPIGTPNIDQLARRGVRFADVWTQSTSALASLASLLTGVSPRETNVLSDLDELAEGAPTLAERFQEAGYATVAVVAAADLRAQWSGLGRGFEWFRCPAEGRARATWASVEAQRQLRGLSDRPLFLWLHLVDPHVPYEAPQPFDRLYWPSGRNPRDARLPPPELPERVLRGPFERLRIASWPEAAQRGAIAFLDHEIASVLEEPRVRRGIVAYAGVHGECLGEHGIFWDHVEPFPEVVRVPLLVAGASTGRGRVIARPCELSGLGRTLLDLAGFEELGFPGSDLFAPLGPADSAQTRPRVALGPAGESAAVGLRNWLYVRMLADHDQRSLARKRIAGEEALFDLESDPDCTRNLRVERTDVREELAAYLDDWLGRMRKTGWGRSHADDPARRRALAPLGHAEE